MAVSSWPLSISNHLFFTKAFCHICIFSYFFQNFSLLTFSVFYNPLHVISYECLYSVLLVQRWKGSQMGFPSRFLGPNITNSQRLWNATSVAAVHFCVIAYLNAYSAIAHTCQFVHPIPPLKYPFFHLKIFGRVLKSWEREEVLCLAWRLACSDESSAERAPTATSILQLQLYFSDAGGI